MTTLNTGHTYRIDMNEGALQATLPQPLMHQDAHADTFTVQLRRGMTPIDLTGAKALAAMHIAATNQTILLTGAVNAACASVTLTDACYAQPGRFTLSIQLTLEDVRHTVLQLEGSIARTASDQVVDEADVVPTLPELLAQLAALEDAAARTEAAIQRAEAAIAHTEAAAAALVSTAPPILLEASGNPVLLEDAADGRALTGLRLYGRTQVTDGALVSPGDAGSITAVAAGINLINSNAETDHRFVSKTATLGAPVVLTTSSATLCCIRAVRVFAGQTYYIRYDKSGEYFSTNSRYGCIVDENDCVLQNDLLTWSAGRQTQRITPACSGYLTFGVDSSATQVMVSLTEDAPWTAPAPANAVSAALTEGLRGIPVTQGGTYTDADGQSWLCDEINFSAGTLTRRCALIAAYAGDDVGNTWLTAPGVLTAGEPVVYALSQPIVTTLPDSVLSDYRALRTPASAALYATADMTAGYIADTQRYIDARTA